ncbi:hypothetical protein [Xanthomonas fragariae]|uniref:hypothetical protein n=1 Tax=Xanthomonas fragariae TaxID=48664 RepID=UPI0022AB16FC|nr:hypothetical protein [Xanthomonas fragariae]WAT15052.1 hypothetical protein OZ429_00205 [Xanthomonas fragariae]
MAIGLASAGARALFGGDVMHHPIQRTYLHWNSCFCADAVLARRSRAWVHDYVVEKRATYFSSHFAGTSVVHATRTPMAVAW